MTLTAAYRTLGAVVLCFTLACAYDDVTSTSIGIVRCTNVECEPPSSQSIAKAQAPASDVTGRAKIGWRRRWACDEGSSCNAANPGLVFPTPLPWFVESDGSMRVVLRAIQRHGAGQKHSISVATLNAEGEQLASDRVVDFEVPDASMQARPIPPPIAMRDRDGSLLIAVKRDPAELGRLSFFSWSTDRPAHQVFELDSVGMPAALAAIGDDVLVLDNVVMAPELKRVARDGSMRWRQVTLLPATGAILASVVDVGVQLLVTRDDIFLTAQGNGIVKGAQWLSRVDGHGRVLDVLQLTLIGATWSGSRNGALIAASHDDLLVGYDAYAVARCSAAGCKPPLSAVSRERDRYYDPALFGMDVDAAQRVYVLTQTGPREQREVLLDRLSSDLRTRESFVIDGAFGLGVAQAIRVRDDRSVYFMVNATPPELGLIELE